MAQDLKNRIMTGVHTAYIARRVLHPITLKIVFIALLSFIGSVFVSFQNVILNMPKVANLSELLQFAVVAFKNTEFTVQTAVIAVALLLAWMLRDIVRNIRGMNGVQYTASRIRN